MSEAKNQNGVRLKDIKINDSFWSKYVQLIREEAIPYQWEALNDRIPDAEPSHAVKNFRIAAGLEQGEFQGFVFQDSDLAKWLEAVAYSLETHPDAELERTADEMIAVIAKAQQEDGYLNTYFTIKEPEKRWTNLLECHELYCAGHMIEAAAAYYNATGKRTLLDCMCRFADYIDSVFGPEPGKLKGYCGHQEIELALVKLYKAVNEERYLKLAKYFIEQRGKEPYYFDGEWERRGGLSHWTGGPSPRPDREYNQSHLPVREQSKAVGHAVRMVYMCTAIADLAAETGDGELLDVCRRLWNNITRKQMYITGGIGSTNHGEAFTFDYDLPNDIIYAETCASVGLVFFAQRMLKLDPRGEYADVLERALYNTVLSGMAQDGKSFFYVNPLEVWPEAGEKNPTRSHVKSVRQKWFGCACCPPNVARLLASLGQYVYAKSGDVLYVNLYMGSEAGFTMGDAAIRLTQRTNYPWDGRVEISVESGKAAEFELALRIPGWCRDFTATVDEKALDGGNAVKDGYLKIKRVWGKETRLALELPMPAELIRANPKVRADAGRVAIQRGPLVYCLEEADNGENLSAIALSDDSELTAVYENGFLGGAVTISGKARRESGRGWGDALYLPLESVRERVAVKAVPYFLWCNRKPGEMAVWINYQEGLQKER